jgi:hypothetical protein
VVLAGGVLTAVPEIRAGVQERLAVRLGRRGILAGDGAAGAAWLAIRSLGRSGPLTGPDAGSLHARLLCRAP